MPVALKPEYAAAASRLGLRRLGNEFCGPCPVCGGNDRFRIGRRGAFCRKCCPDSGDAAAVKRLLEAAGLGRKPDWKPEPIDHAALAAPAKTLGTNDPDEQDPLVRRLIMARDPVVPKEARDYLADRLCWPPAALRIPPPKTVGWLSARALSRSELSGSVPPGAVGAIMFLWARLGRRVPAALTLMALNARSERLLWFGTAKTRAVGPRKGTAFAARDPRPGAETHICEGEIDALALAWTAPGGCLAAGGTSGLLAAANEFAGDAVLHADGDPDGRKFAEIARHKAAAAKVVFCPTGHDPASEHAAMIDERAAIREYDGGLPRDQALAAAWQDLFIHQINNLKEGK